MGGRWAASLGLTPKQNSSGGKERLLGINKRGDFYMRCLLIHGARAMIQMARRRTDALISCVGGLYFERPRKYPLIKITILILIAAFIPLTSMQHERGVFP
jgi:hypothetical protein